MVNRFSMACVRSILNANRDAQLHLSYSEVEPPGLEKRSSKLPPLRISTTHPLIPTASRAVFKRAVIVKIDTTPRAMKKLYGEEKSMGRPKGGPKDWLNAGEYEINSQVALKFTLSIQVFLKPNPAT